MRHTAACSPEQTIDDYPGKTIVYVICGGGEGFGVGGLELNREMR